MSVSKKCRPEPPSWSPRFTQRVSEETSWSRALPPLSRGGFVAWSLRPLRFLEASVGWTRPLCLSSPWIRHRTTAISWYFPALTLCSIRISQQLGCAACGIPCPRSSWMRPQSMHWKGGGARIFRVCFCKVPEDDKPVQPPLPIMTFTNYDNPHIVIPPSTDGRVCLVSTAVPWDFRSHCSNGAHGLYSPISLNFRVG